MASIHDNSVLDVILSQLDGAHSVLDVGCGDGGLTRALTKRRFVVTGVDPQVSIIARAQMAAPKQAFVATSAADLPFDVATFDAAVFLNSLHHIALPEMAQAIIEVSRCVVPKGRIIVVEPLADGALFDVVRIIDDETEVRGAAQLALDMCSLTPVSDFCFSRISHYHDAAAFLTSLIAAEPARRTAIAAKKRAMLQAIKKYAVFMDGKITLVQPMRLRSFSSPG